MTHSAIIDGLLAKIWTIEKDTITIGLLVLIPITVIFYFKLVRKSF